MVIAGIDYGDKDLDFINILCDFEDMGIDIMGMMNGGIDTKTFTFTRAIVSVYTGEKNLEECGKKLTAHLAMGGSLNDLLDPFIEAMNRAGFGQAAEEKTPKTPQDHKKKATKTVELTSQNTEATEN